MYHSPIERTHKNPINRNKNIPVATISVVGTDTKKVYEPKTVTKIDATKHSDHLILFLVGRFYLLIQIGTIFFLLFVCV